MFGDIRQWPTSYWVGSSGHGRATSRKGVSRTGWVHSSGQSFKQRRLFYGFNVRWIMHVWNTPGKGSFLRECVVIKSSQIGHRFMIAAWVRSSLKSGVGGAIIRNIEIPKVTGKVPVKLQVKLWSWRSKQVEELSGFPVHTVILCSSEFWGHPLLLGVFKKYVETLFFDSSIHWFTLSSLYSVYIFVILWYI